MPTAKPSATPASKAVDPAELVAIFRGFEGRSGVLLAVSGGADSTAMMLLAARWRAAGGTTPLTVATVDHRLRSGSDAEGALVAEQAATLRLPCMRLAWADARPGSGLQERARQARYRLLVDEARAAGCDAITTAHTLEDQAETVLMRALRGSGIDGLAAMREETQLGPVRHLRPLLGMPKSRLVATLKDAGWQWSDDPSNRDPRHERVRLRSILSALERPAVARLARLAERSARAADALDSAAAALIASAGHDSGILADAWAQAPAEVRLRALARMLDAAASGGVPRLERLERLEASLVEAYRADRPMARTLQGCVVRLKEGRIVVAGAPPRRLHQGMNHDSDRRLGAAAMPWQDIVAPLD